MSPFPDETKIVCYKQYAWVSGRISTLCYEQHKQVSTHISAFFSIDTSIFLTRKLGFSYKKKYKSLYCAKETPSLVCTHVQGEIQIGGEFW